MRMDDKALAALAGDDDDKTMEQLEAEAVEEQAIEGEAAQPDDPRDDDAPKDEPAESAVNDQAPPERRVPLAELVAERRSRQEAQEQARALQARIEALERAQQQPPAAEQPPADPEPDYLDDPKGHLEWQLRQRDKQITDLRSTVEKLTGGVQQITQQEQLANTLAASENAFVKDHPDYGQALQHAREQALKEVIAETEALGIQATRDQLLQYITGQERQLAVSLVQRGINPAEYVYNLAMKRYGYAPAQQQAAPQAPQPQKGAPVQDAVRNALRGLPSGDGGLQRADAPANIPGEFASAFAERFGSRG